MKKRLQFLDIFDSRQKRKLVLVALLFLLAAALETASLAVIYPFMRSLLDPAGIASSAWYRLLCRFFRLGSYRETLGVFSLVLVLLYLLKAGFLLMVNRVEFRILTDMRADISQKLFSGFLHLPYAVLRQKNSAEVQRTLTTDVSYVFSAVTALLSLVQQSLTGLAFTGMLLAVDLKLTCGLALLMVLGFLLFRRLTGRVTTAAGQRTRTAFVGMIRTVRESMSMLKQIQATHGQKTFEDMFDEFREDHAREERKVLFFQRLPRILFETLIMCAVLLYIAWTVHTGADFASRLPVFITFALTTVKLIPVVSQLANNFNTLRFTENSTARVLEVMEECRIGHESAVPVPAAGTALRDGIEINHLSFGFEDDEPLLDDVSFRIPAHQLTAFTGKTGAGKTTLADIILGLYPVRPGTILADGHDISLEPEWWAAHVGYVTQTVTLRDDTVRENITRGQVSDRIDEERIWQCLEDVQLASFIRSLPEGLNTRTGEAGIRFSGGQVQRLAIARALYNDPAFLVLDESTSALDSETEAQVLETLQKLRETRTILLITHRSAASGVCDMVYRVEDRKVHQVLRYKVVSLPDAKT